jgi:YD repeat-containing protein
VTSYTWHTSLRLPLTRTTASLLETFTYTPEGLVLTYSQKDTKVGSPTLNQVRTWNYTYTTLASGLKVLSTVDGPGLVANGITDVTSYIYTTTGDLATVTDPNGLVTTVLARNDQGQPTSVRGPDLNLWTFTYDRMGRVLTSGFAAPGQTALPSIYVYDVAGQLTSYTNGLGKIWSFTYNAAQRLVKTVSPTGDTTNFTYNAAGDVTRRESKNGTGPVTFWEETQFDALSRVLKTVGAQGQEWAYTHDKEDNLATETDPLSNVTTNGFDALNRLTSVVDRQNFTTGQKYNAADQLTEYTDPRTIKTTFTYNGFGEVVSEVSADRGTIGYTYDQRGLVKSRTDGRGITVNYSYDNGGRPTLMDYPTGGIPDQTITWDTALLGNPVDAQKGKVARITDGVIHTTFGEAAAGTAIRSSYTALYPLNRSYAMWDETSLAGQLTRTKYPSGSQVWYTYNNDGEITGVTWKVGSVSTPIVSAITYRPNGPIASMLYGDGATQTRSYDASYRLTGLTDVKGSTTLRQMTYGYEARDNLTAVTDVQTPANTETYGYTARESLTSATGPYGTMAFTYDGVGNRITYQVNPGTGLLTDTYSYPATSNRLSSVALGAGGSRAFTYDAAGSVTLDM